MLTKSRGYKARSYGQRLVTSDHPPPSGSSGAHAHNHDWEYGARPDHGHVCCNKGDRNTSALGDATDELLGGFDHAAARSPSRRDDVFNSPLMSAAGPEFRCQHRGAHVSDASPHGSRGLAQRLNRRGLHESVFGHRCKVASSLRKLQSEYR